MIVLSEPLKFQWDKANFDKNKMKHGIEAGEIERAFFDPNKKILKDKLHSKTEDRYILLAMTRVNYKLFIVFTVRDDEIRVISARPLNKKEVFLYE